MTGEHVASGVTEPETCADCGGRLGRFSGYDYPGGGFYRCYRCRRCGETGWRAMFVDGTVETGGCVGDGV